MSKNIFLLIFYIYFFIEFSQCLQNPKGIIIILDRNKWSVFFPTKKYNHGNMFNNCNVLVGGNGTRYVDLKVNDKTYALADAEGTPGYLTYKAN